MVCNPRPGAMLTEGDLRDHLCQALPSFKVPEIHDDSKMIVPQRYSEARQARTAQRLCGELTQGHYCWLIDEVGDERTGHVWPRGDYFRCRRRFAPADRTASVTVLTIGLSSFQHCQNSGTSRCTSQMRTKLPSASAASANCSGYMPHPRPALTAAP